MTISETAMSFFEACETGKGWNVCKAWCHDGASFSCQSGALAEMNSLEAYAEWMQGFLIPVPDGRYELKAFATDDERAVVLAYAIFHGTHTDEGGPVDPTGNEVSADYVYAMKFDGDKIRHMTKIWNDGHSLDQLGWG